ncbi:hypothetical protein ACFCVY_13820 [Streptomyces sp. NPDC056411]|uniref:hypothetical protein n=1 Tax=Streptomyces sp. NPDC056411 TaxID=3345813 RepID=UPI0035DA1258
METIVLPSVLRATVGAGGPHVARRAVAGRQAPLRPLRAVDRGGLPEGLLLVLSGADFLSWRRKREQWRRRVWSTAFRAAVARRADVSRTFRYDNPKARASVVAAMTEAGERRTQMLADQDDEHEATWRERARNAEEGLTASRAGILTQRKDRRIAELEAQLTGSDN